MISLHEQGLRPLSLLTHRPVYPQRSCSGPGEEHHQGRNASITFATETRAAARTLNLSPDSGYCGERLSHRSPAGSGCISR
jgi:hypothetical protein